MGGVYGVSLLTALWVQGEIIVVKTPGRERGKTAEKYRPVIYQADPRKEGEMITQPK